MPSLGRPALAKPSDETIRDVAACRPSEPSTAHVLRRAGRRTSTGVTSTASWMCASR